MKVYVAGGLGFIGHNVASILSRQGHSCTVIDCLEDYGILNKFELNKIIAERKAIISSDITIQDISNPLFITDADAIIHLASFPRAKAVDLNPSRASQAMHVGTVRLCEAAKKCNAKMIYISSSMVYGDWQDTLAKEEHTCNPKGLYALMKLQGEQLVRAMCPNNHVIIRPSAVYGPRDVTDRVVSLMFKAAIAGNPIRVEGPDNMLDFTYIDDVANGIACTVSSEQNATVNMSRGRGRSLLELATLIKDITGSSSKIDIVEHNTRYPLRGAQDITIARNLFNFDPTIELEQGLQLYYSWLTR